MESLNLINGNIITLDSANPAVSSISISNGKINGINQLIKGVKTLDLKGATVIPGFIDAHFHLKNYGKRLEQLNLKGVCSLKEIEKLIQSKLTHVQKGEWILGFGWDQNLWATKEFPKSEFLNTISPHNPIYFTRIDGHSSWVNQRAILLMTAL